MPNAPRTYRAKPSTSECQVCGDSDASLWGRPSDPGCILLVCTRCVCTGKAGRGGFAIVRPSTDLLGSPAVSPEHAKRYARKWVEYRARFA